MSRCEVSRPPRKHTGVPTARALSSTASRYRDAHTPPPAAYSLTTLALHLGHAKMRVDSFKLGIGATINACHKRHTTRTPGADAQLHEACLRANKCTAT